MKRGALYLVATLHFLAIISGCGSGGGPASGNPSNNPPPPPGGDFALAVESQTVTVQQGGTAQFQTIQANPTNGFIGTIQLTLSGLPVGVANSGSSSNSIVVSAGPQGASFQLVASTAASVGTNTIVVTGTSGSITHTVTFSMVVSTAAPFTIQVAPPVLSLTPGTSATVQVSIAPNSTTASQLSVTLPDTNTFTGVNITLPQGFLTSSNPVSFLINPTPLAQPLQNYPFIITATDGSGNSTTFSLSLTVSIPFASNATPTRSTFTRTGQSPTGIVYDQARKLVFVSVEILDEVVVLSSVDGHIVSTIPVNYPAGIDEAADGSAVYVVSPYFGGFTIIDPNLLQVVGHVSVPSSVSGISQPFPFFQVAALSNGKVMLFPAYENFGFSGPPFFVWDPTSSTFERIGGSAFGTVNQLISRSADRSKVLIGLNPGVEVYDVGSNTFSAPNNAVGSNSAMSPDGSQIVSVGLQNSTTIFYDSNFNTLASLQLDAFPLTGVVYSHDGKHLYVLGQQTSSSQNIAAVVDTTTFSVVGVVPGFSFGASLPFSGQWLTTFDTDETGMLFGAAFNGVGFLDMTSPTFLKDPLPGSFQFQSTLASLTSATPNVVSGTGFTVNSGLNLFVGAPPASPKTLEATNPTVQSTNQLNLTIPPGTTPGPANATLTRNDGYFEVMPDAVTFGPTILAIDGDSGSPAGGDSITIFGYGFDTQNVQVTIGGKLATTTQVDGNVGSGGGLPTDFVILNTPPGISGPADVTVTVPSGLASASTTATGGFHYLTSAQVYARVGALDAIIYDKSRQRLYVSNDDHNEVEIFDLIAHQFLSPVAVGNVPTAVALTPDSSLLAVLNTNDGTVSVINLATLQVIAIYPVLTAADRSCGGVAFNMSAVEPHRVVVAINCTGGLLQGLYHLINLDSGVLSCVGVPSCSTNGTDMNLGVPGGVASTPDGTKVFFSSGYQGPDLLIDFVANTLLSTGFTNSNTDAAANVDGNAFAATFAVYNAQLAGTSIMAWESYVNAGAQSLNNVIGEKLNPSGSLLFFPQNSGVTIFDVHNGRLVRHLVLPDPIPLDTNGMALDETGTKMFLISNTGVTVAQLDQEPLSLATVTPSSGPSGTTVVLRGSGFQIGTTATIGGTQASVTFVDGETLNVIVPPISLGVQRITLTNPGGETYSFDDAFSLN